MDKNDIREALDEHRRSQSIPALGVAFGFIPGSVGAAFLAFLLLFNDPRTVDDITAHRYILVISGSLLAFGCAIAALCMWLHRRASKR